MSTKLTVLAVDVLWGTVLVSSSWHTCPILWNASSSRYMKCAHGMDFETLYRNLPATLHRQADTEKDHLWRPSHCQSLQYCLFHNGNIPVHPRQPFCKCLAFVPRI